jgi:hypothetical protein
MVVSRRWFFGKCFEAVLLSVAGRTSWAPAQSLVSARIGLIKEFNNAFLQAISSDSERICICYRGKKPPLRLVVVELNSWRELYSVSLPGLPSGFAFFPGGESLNGIVRPAVTVWNAMHIDLRTGSTETQSNPFFGKAATRGILIGFRGKRLVQLEWPSLREIVGVEVANVDAVAMDKDRNRLIHVVGQELICRRIADFAVIWTRRISDEFDMSPPTTSGFFHVGILCDFR